MLCLHRIQHMEQGRISKHYISIWLVIGLIMVAGQIWIGGVTRLTGSGLSITKWEIVTGTLPPLNDQQWEESLQLYRETPQYALINKGMSMEDFKVIYFWEYFHRLWARIMGFVFILPFIFFVYKKWLSKVLIINLVKLIFLTGITASFGWIMVASGLSERPWVNIYKLGIHLLLGFSVFTYLFWIYQRHRVDFIKSVKVDIKVNRLFQALFWLIVVQIYLGAMVSGLKAGFSYPTWPLMHGAWIPELLFDANMWRLEHFISYEDSDFLPALVTFLHRNNATVIAVLSLIVIMGYFKNRIEKGRRVGPVIVYILFLLAQILLGIMTVLAFKQGMPVALGSLHQMVGLGVLVSLFYLSFINLGEIRNNKV